jgi:hypothetical protein
VRMAVPVRAEVNRLTVLHVKRRAAFGLQLVLWLLCLLTLVAIVLQLGVWRKQIDIAGPFARETNPPQHALVVAVPSEGAVPWWRQPLIGDSAEKPFESKLRLRIAGREIWPAHSDPSLIREGNSTGYSHRGSELVFSLPPGVRNAPATVITLWYKIRPRLWLTLALMLLTLALGLLLYYEALWSLALAPPSRLSSAYRHAWRWTPLLYSVPYVLVSGFCLLGLAGTVVFLGASLYAWATGWALPTTAPIRWSSLAEWAARNELYFGYLVLTLAGFGIVMRWLSVLTRQSEVTTAYEARLRAFLKWSGFPIAFDAFLLCASAMWDGMARPGDAHWANVGGLVPYNDAHGHLAEAFFQANTGSWTAFALRRPLAAALRSVLLFGSGYSFPVMLAIQICLIAFAVFVASCWVTKWRGIWAGLTFFGLIYIYTRIFLPTSLTEPLGIFWSLLSVPFFVESFRSGSARPALVGLAMTSMALMTRMASMFTIPALLLWLVWQFGRSVSDKLRIGILAIGIMIGVVGLSSLVSKVYGTAGTETGSNFSYVVCGLSTGTTWDGCPAKLAKQGEPLQGDEAAVARKLYAFAWQNFKADPTIFFMRLAAAAREFLRAFPTVIWKGYGAAVAAPIWLFQNFLTIICIVGLCYAVAFGMNRIEVSFWVLFWASVVASAAIIYYDDGARTLASSHPLIALFLATGMSAGAPASGGLPVNRQLVRAGISALIATAAAFVTVPWISHLVWSVGEKQVRSYQPDDAFVSGGRTISGFLVVADGEALRPDIPTIHFSEFQAIIAQSGIEPDIAVLHPKAPATPFGFVYAPRMEHGGLIAGIFVVPVEVLEHADVSAWHFAVPSVGAGSSYRFNVTKAEPSRP